jgi:antitoxin (DNA-binding transcriptional repressor) of toxin-antitoxin stability system
LKTLELAQATDSLAKAARGLSKSGVLLTRRGKPLALLVPLKESELEAARLSVNPEFMRIIERSRRSLRRRGGLSIEQVRRRLGHGRRHA